MHETFMRRALDIARRSLDETGALPYAAVIVKDGQIVGEGLNRVDGKKDPTSHGEVEAIRDACARLATTDLSGCDLYTTAEPCSMCVATMYLVALRRFYYASAVAESSAFLGRLAARDPRWKRPIGGVDLRREVGLPIDQRQMEAIPLLAGEAHAVFADYAKRQGA